MAQAERDDPMAESAVPACATCGADVDPADEKVFGVVGADGKTHYWCDDDCIARFPIGEQTGTGRGR